MPGSTHMDSFNINVAMLYQCIVVVLVSKNITVICYALRCLCSHALPVKCAGKCELVTIRRWRRRG